MTEHMETRVGSLQELERDRVNKELAKIRKKFTSSKTLSEYDRKKYAPFPRRPSPALYRPLTVAARPPAPPSRFEMIENSGGEAGAE